MSSLTSAGVTERRNARVARFVMIRRAHAVSPAAPAGIPAPGRSAEADRPASAGSSGRAATRPRAEAGVQRKILRRLGESVALVAVYGPSIRTVPTCGKKV